MSVHRQGRFWKNWLRLAADFWVTAGESGGLRRLLGHEDICQGDGGPAPEAHTIPCLPPLQQNIREEVGGGIGGIKWIDAVFCEIQEEKCSKTHNHKHSIWKKERVSFESDASFIYSHPLSFLVNIRYIIREMLKFHPRLAWVGRLIFFFFKKFPTIHSIARRIFFLKCFHLSKALFPET